MPFDPEKIKQNPNKTRCSATTTLGQPCKSWAVRDSDPPLCATHMGLTVGGGAPKGNQNALKHGFYSRVISEAESAQLVGLMQSGEIDDELAMTRVLLRRVLEKLNESTTLDDFERLSRLYLLGVRTTAGLIKAGGPQTTFRDVLDSVLGDLGNSWNADL